MITMNQIHYVAGLLEGEGCFSFYKTPKISLGMTDKDIIIKVSNIIYPNCNIEHIREEGNRKDIYRFALYGAGAIQWMMTLYPLMGERRKARIKEIISIWKTKMQYRFVDGLCRHGHPFIIVNQDYVYNINGAKLCLHCRKLRSRSISFRSLHTKGLHNVSQTI